MSRDSSGTYTLPAGNPVVNGTAIDPSWANTTLTDIGSELTNSLDKAGRTLPTANLPMGGFKFTGLGAGAAAGQSVRYEQSYNIGETTVTAAASGVNLETSYTGCILFSGTASVTGFAAATVAGIYRVVRFDGACTLNHNSSTLDCPNSQDITTVSGDEMLVKSTSTGWKVVAYFRKTGAPVSGFPNGTVSAPSIFFGSDTNNGFYRISTDTWGASVGGVLTMSLGDTTCSYLGRDANASATAGALAIYKGGTGQTSGIGGAARLGGGDGGSSGNGGALHLTGGQAGATGASAGDVKIRGGVAAAGTNAAVRFQLPASSDAATGTDVTVLTKDGHWEESNDAGVPTITSGAGTGATIEGNDNLILLTFGTGAGTAVVLTFAVAYTNAPAAFPNYGASNIAVWCTTTTTTVTINFASAPANGAVLHLWIRGWQT